MDMMPIGQITCTGYRSDNRGFPTAWMWSGRERRSGTSSNLALRN